MLKELPKKWCCKGYEEVAEYSNIHGENPIYHETMSKGIISYHHYPRKYTGVTASSEIGLGYTEITLEEFKRLVLKLPDYQDIKTRIKNLKI